MASDAPPLFHEDEDLLDEDDPANDTDNDSSSSAAALHVTTPIPPPAQQPITTVKKPTAQIDESSSKLFQRLWTDEDEIELLKGYLDYTTQRSNTSGGTHHHDTSAFYDQIRSKFQLDFNKNQLVEKLRRLKKKYRNVVNKFGSGKEYVFKSPHDQATFEISSRIWGNILVGNGSSSFVGFRTPAAVVEDVEDVDPESPNLNNDIDMNSKFPRPRKRSRVGGVKVEEKQVEPVGVALAGSISGVIEETVKSCLSPIFKELLGNGGVNGAVLSPMPLGFGSIGSEKLGEGRWRKQQILELEVFSKRLKLMQDEVDEKLQELRSMGE